MKNLAKRLSAAEAEVARLRRLIRASTCAEIGSCDWQHTGGCNAGCDPSCTCSVPVHVCRRCGDCDYGRNADASEVRRECAGARELEDGP